MSPSVYVAGQVLKKLLNDFPDKVDGQQVVAERKARKVYEALEAYPEVYRIVPDKAVRSRMNICFRVVKVGAFTPPCMRFIANSWLRTATSTSLKRPSSREAPSVASQE